ncbi:MAG: hypothetical protein A2042_07530 [Candidatus Schekmanbacteria bacterium GWA2_38_11]|uniref:PKD domain-containing protein n=1 Tax=Candidatus Schekmanbacteria bacterium GWA2_38_11 TaxID=1817876 RepID=A0A1F7RIU0_9BACT|nr:MAG: hypothetical protein A2042_07530 [Candidatus Schekmanbacteria bacterium GWA2_38_11]
MSKKKKFNNYLMIFSFAVILCGAGFLLSSDGINALCRVPVGCTVCHDLIGNSSAIIGDAEDSCDLGDFNFGPDLSEARFIHRTFKLNDGRVLFTGGARALTNPYTVNTSVDIYNPATNTMTPAAPMSQKRLSHMGATLKDGRVLVCGGRTTNVGTTPGAGVVASAEIYNPATNTWTPTGSLNIARRSGTATVLNDGRVLIAGGQDRASATSALPMSSNEIYNPATGTFTLIGNMTTPRASHSAVLLDDGTVLINGGSNGLGTAFPTKLAEIFNPADNSFTAVGPSLFPHLAQVGVKLRDGKVLLAGTYYNVTHTAEGGNMSPECEIYDPVTRTFKATGSLLMKRIDVGGQLLLDGTVLLSGGVSTDFQRRYPTMFQTSSEIYDPRNGLWSASGLMVDGRDEFSGVALDDGRVYVTGGFTRAGTPPVSTLLKTTEMYTPGLGPQIAGLYNVINDLPLAAIKNNNQGQRQSLLADVDNIAKFLNMRVKENKYEEGEHSAPFFGHILYENGVFHRPGLQDPLTNCVGCHGADLKGDGSRPSCYSCHGPIWNQTNPEVKLNDALSQAKKMLSQMDSCSNGAATDDLIYFCDYQRKTRSVVQVLVNTLTDMTAPNQLPTVTVTATPTSGSAPLAVNFTSTASDPDGTIASYFWQFGDSQFSYVANPSHTYTCGGAYTVSLRVTDNKGGTAEATIQINVSSTSSGIDYNCDVQPIFNRECIGCHGAMGGLNLQSCAGVQAGSSNGPVVVPGNATASVLYQEISSGDMPPSSTMLPPNDIATIGAWINSLDPNDPNFCD